jgi:putative ABC transport system permease protein
MKRFRAFWQRIFGLFRADQRDADLACELDSHLALHIDDNLRDGMSPDEARRHALIQLGGLDQTKESVRDRRGLPLLESLLQDIRFGLRVLRKNPVFALTAIASLSLAIGANTAVYSIIDVALLRPLPVSQPDRLFTLSSLQSDQPGASASEARDVFSYPLYQQLSTAAGNSAQLALFDSPGETEVEIANPNAQPEKVTLQSVSPNALDVLGVAPATGTLFSPDDERYPGARDAVVLSYDYWQRRFGADASIVGRTITLNNRPLWVLGITQKGFFGTDPGRAVDVWVPVTTGDPGVLSNPEYRAFHLMGRLAPGLTRARLEAQLQPTFHHHQVDRAEANSTLPASLQYQLRNATLRVLPGATGFSSFRDLFSRPLWILLAVSVCILVIACANVASLLLARAAARSGEMALRLSLGAGRTRLLRQLLTESLLIALAALPCAWIVARAAAPALVGMASKSNDPITLNVALDARVLLLCAAVCILSALLFGLFPALQASSTRPMLALRSTSGEAGRLRLGRIFVAVQVAFAFCLVTTGTGFLFSLSHLAGVDRGFDARNVTVLTITNVDTQQRDRQWTLMQELLSGAENSPGVQGAATGWVALFSSGRRAQRIVVPGKPPSDEVETFYRVSPGYFATLHTPLLAGRDFTFSDNDNEPVATIVNRAFAQKYFGTTDVIGSEFRRDDGVLHQIVGLAADSHYVDLRMGAEPIAYMPMKPPRIFILYVRSAAGPAAVSQGIERQAVALNSGVHVSGVTTLDALVDDTIVEEKLLGTVGGALAFFGLALAAIGLFGLLNYSVTRRTKEIGIRAALGAPRTQIYSLILSDLAGMTFCGIAVGLAASIALLRLAHAYLFGVATVDPVVIGSALVVFLGAAMIAGALPARRAASIDPFTAIRSE